MGHHNWDGEFKQQQVFFFANHSMVRQWIYIYILVGGLEHLDYFSIYWEFHHPN